MNFMKTIVLNIIYLKQHICLKSTYDLNTIYSNTKPFELA